MKSGFELVRPDDVMIAGLPSADLMIRAGGRPLGRLRGFVVDGAQRQIRYLVVRASGLFAKAKLIPFADARVDLDARAIDVALDERDLWQLRNFTVEQLLTA